MNPHATPVIMALVIALTILAFAVWVRPPRTLAARRSPLRSRVVFVVATSLFALSMTAFGRFVGGDSVVFAVVLTLVVIGWTAFVNDVLPMRLPRFLERRPVIDLTRKKWYRRFGVFGFGRLLRHTPLRYLNPVVYLRTTGDLVQLRRHVMTAESVHFWGMLFSLPYFLICVFFGWWTAGAAVLVVQIPMNIYPMLHLHLTKARILRYQAGTLGRRPGDGLLA